MDHGQQPIEILGQVLFDAVAEAGAVAALARRVMGRVGREGVARQLTPEHAVVLLFGDVLTALAAGRQGLPLERVLRPRRVAAGVPRRPVCNLADRDALGHRGPAHPALGAREVGRGALGQVGRHGFGTAVMAMYPWLCVCTGA